MLCCVVLCYVMLCYVMLCYVMLCYVMLFYVMLCYVMLCYVMLCYVMLSAWHRKISTLNLVRVIFDVPSHGYGFLLFNFYLAAVNLGRCILLTQALASLSGSASTPVLKFWVKDFVQVIILTLEPLASPNLTHMMAAVLILWVPPEGLASRRNHLY